MYLAVRELLNRIFPYRWTGRRGAVEWSSRSPNLNPIVFFFYGIHLNSRWNILVDYFDYRTESENHIFFLISKKSSIRFRVTKVIFLSFLTTISNASVHTRTSILVHLRLSAWKCKSSKFWICSLKREINPNHHTEKIFSNASPQ